MVIDSSLTSFEMVSKTYVNYTWCERDANVLLTALKAIDPERWAANNIASTLQHCGELNWAFPNIVGNLGVILHCGDLSFLTDHQPNQFWNGEQNLCQLYLVWMRCKCLVDCSEGKLILSDELPTILQVTLQHCGELNWAFPNIVGNLGAILHCGDLSFSTDHQQV
jgi:hypothetical protein